MTREGMCYLKALLEDDDEAPQVRAIARNVWHLVSKGRDEVLEYLTSVMTDNARESEAFDVAYRIWWLMGERGAAA